MARKERYRIWLKNGKYEVAVAKNRDDALGIVLRRGIKATSIKSVGKATSRGRQFKVDYENRTRNG
jgi:hypothetical protein